MKERFYPILPRQISQKIRLHRYYPFLHHILISKMNADYLVISYDDKLFIPVNVSGNGNCLLRALAESAIILINDSKTFRSDLSIRTKILLKN